jgi:hypothetical protein
MLIVICIKGHRTETLVLSHSASDATTAIPAPSPPLLFHPSRASTPPPLPPRLRPLLLHSSPLLHIRAAMVSPDQLRIVAPFSTWLRMDAAAALLLLSAGVQGLNSPKSQPPHRFPPLLVTDVRLHCLHLAIHGWRLLPTLFTDWLRVLSSQQKLRGGSGKSDPTARQGLLLRAGFACWCVTQRVAGTSSLRFCSSVGFRRYNMLSMCVGLRTVIALPSPLKWSWGFIHVPLAQVPTLTPLDESV